MVQENVQDEISIMRTHEGQSRISRSRSWSGGESKLIFKLLTLALLAFMLFLKPASTLSLSNCESDSPSTLILDRNITGNLDSSGGSKKKPGARRTLLQNGRFRPSPTGYPPPGDNQQAVPRAPSFGRRPP